MGTNKLLQTIFITIIFLVSFTVKEGKALEITCPPGSQLVTVEFDVYFEWTDTMYCKDAYYGLCRYRGYYCVSCDISHPEIRIEQKGFELIPLDELWDKKYFCTCYSSLTLPSLDWRVKLINNEGLSALLYKLLDQHYCLLNICGEEPPSGAIYVKLEKLDCYKLKYVPGGLGTPGYVALEYCPDNGYCEMLYRVCVEIDPLTGQAKLKNELISVTHFGVSNCIARELVLPPGTSFPRWGFDFPDETECMYDPVCE